MAVVEVDLLPRKGNIVGPYSVNESASSLDASNFDGGSGQLTFQMDDYRDAPSLLGKTVTLGDGSRGKFQAVVQSVSGTDGVVSVTSTSVLGLFNAWSTIPPFQGTLSGYVTALCSVVNIPNGIDVDATVASRSVVTPGFTGNMWDCVKQFLVAQQVEMSLVYNRVVVRPARTVTAFMNRATRESYSVDSGVAGLNVEVAYYNHAWGSQVEAYPVASALTTDVLTVDAGQVVTRLVTIEGSLLTVNQPVVQDYVNNATYAGTNGVYCVAGNDGLPVTSAQWTHEGGSVRVSQTDDPSVLEVTITGPSNQTLSPYRIAATSGSNNYYNTLRITGTGVLWDRQTLTLSTGAPASTTGDPVGVQVDNPYISTLAQAYTTGLIVAGAYSGSSYRISGSAFAINRPGTDDSVISATIADFNAAHVGDTIADFNTLWSGSTIADFNILWGQEALTRFSNQLFGQGIGARIMRDDAAFRITNTTTTPTSVEYEATMDTTLGDFSGAWASSGVGLMASETLTTDETLVPSDAGSPRIISEFNMVHSGRTIRDFNLIPLRNTP